jgi:signal transduction histidine kinase
MRKDDFINMASHELKTPITSINLYLESLARKIKETRNTKEINLIKAIENQTARLQDLVEDLLDVSRIQTGKLNFRKENFRLDELVDEITGSFNGATQQEIIFSPRPKISIRADRFRISQVLTNLIQNAVKYSYGNGSIKVGIKRESGKVLIYITDEGIGIDKDEQEKVFDKLYQANSPTERTYPGLGIGLYISKEIVRRHKGKIWVQSQKGKGSTFYFSLPLQ